MGRPLIDGIGNDLAVVLELPQTQQAIVVRRLLFRWNAEPQIIGIKLLGHWFHPLS
jgi:hypothetical protein